MDFRNNEEDYIKTIYTLIEAFGSANEIGISSDLNVSMPTVSEYLNKLEAKNIIKKFNRKIYLTTYGLDLAAPIMIRHRISEVFAVKMLDVPWEESHDAVMDIEHSIDDLHFNKLRKNLGNPDRCPHGNPINIKENPNIVEFSINQVPEGRYKLSRIIYEENNLLKKFADASILPGQNLTFYRDGRSIIISGNNEFKIPEKLAGSFRLVTSYE